MTETTTIDRASWLGYRWSRHVLGPDHDGTALDDLLTLGVQGNRQSHGEHALSQRVGRVGDTPVAEAISIDGPLVYMWSVRGAPHAHRAEQLDLIRDGLAPLPSDDGGEEFVRGVDDVAAALAEIVTGKTSKSEASTKVSTAVSPSLVSYCARCEARHVPEGLFRAAGRQAQIVLGPDERRATILHPRPAVVQDSVDSPRQRLLEAFFRVNGPITRPLYRGWTETGAPGAARLWDGFDDEMVRVRIGSKRYDLPQSLVDPVRSAPPARGVALVPQNDPYLRQTDRALLVSDPARRQEVFKALSGPGAVLVDGEIAGTWRYRRSPAQVTITLFDAIDSAQKEAAEAKAQAIAASTADDVPAVVWS